METEADFKDVSHHLQQVCFNLQNLQNRAGWSLWISVEGQVLEIGIMLKISFFPTRLRDKHQQCCFVSSHTGSEHVVPIIMHEDHKVVEFYVAFVLPVQTCGKTCSTVMRTESLRPVQTGRCLNASII